MKYRLLLFFATFTFFFSTAHAQTITTYAGIGVSGYSGDGGQATAAKLKYPRNVCFDTANNLYVSDRLNNVIRKISKTGIITTVAGTGVAGYTADGGQATAAKFKIIGGIAADKKGNIYFSEGDSTSVRKVNAAGVLTTIAGGIGYGYSGDGGPATAAKFMSPSGLQTDTAGNLFVADPLAQCIRKINTAGIITTVAGTGFQGYSGDGGLATAATFYGPSAVNFDNAGNMYISDCSNFYLRKVNTMGIITSIAGNGTNTNTGDGGLATAAGFGNSLGITFDVAGNIYISDATHSTVRKIDQTTSIITTFAGNGTNGYSGDGGLATAAQLYGPNNIAIDKYGNIFFAEEFNHTIRRVRSTVGVERIEAVAPMLLVAPNPSANGQFTLKITSEDIDAVHVVVTNITGITIAEQNSYTNKETILQLTNQPTGIYFISATTQHGTRTEKIVIGK